MITSRSASSSASVSWWVVSTTVTPSRRSASINSHTTSRACASMPAVGSSRNTSSGRPTTAQASASRCCWPPDSRRYVVRAASVRPEGVQQPRRVQRVGGVGGHQVEHLAGARRRVAAAALQHHPDARAHARVVGDRVQAEDLDGAGVGLDEALAHLDRRGLARAVGAEQRAAPRRRAPRGRGRTTAVVDPYRLLTPRRRTGVAGGPRSEEVTGIQRRRRVAASAGVAEAARATGAGHRGRLAFGPGRQLAPRQPVVGQRDEHHHDHGAGQRWRPGSGRRVNRSPLAVGPKMPTDEGDDDRRCCGTPVGSPTPPAG